MRVIRQIDAGGFGNVEEVELQDGTRVARKTFEPAMRLAPAELLKFRRRFEREVAVQRALPDHLVLSVLDSDLSGTPAWFTMPLASGNFGTQIVADRAARTVSGNPLAAILEALEEVHRLGYVHRDLKPQNVLYHDGRWKLSDFGLVLVQSGTTRLTSTNSAWGTREYAAPEQANEFRDVTAAADIYSFGCILHDLVDGMPRIPFQRYTVAGHLAPVVEKCTEVEPHRRFRNVSDLRGALMTVLTAPVTTTADQETQDWATKLDSAGPWTIPEFEQFLRFLGRIDAASDDAALVFRALTDDRLEHLHTIDVSLWTPLVRLYCNWTDRGFDWNYCDVLAGRLKTIYMLGDIGLKVDAVLAAAELGVSHNRWYVMQRLVAMCGPSIDQALAERIAIEIGIERVAEKFRTSVAQIGQTTSSYHPTIAAVL